MTFIGSANPMNLIREKGDMLACSSHTREINLRSILVRTVSWRRFKKPENDSCETESVDPLEITSRDAKPAIKESNLELDLSSSHNSIQWKSSLPTMIQDSCNSLSSEDSFAGEDSKCFECSSGDFSSEDGEQYTKKSSNDLSHQPTDSSRLRTTRSLERQTSRMRRKQNKSREYSLRSALDLGESCESLDSVSSYDETFEKMTDSLELGSSRHSVGRCGRRRSTHNRHLHHRPKQQSLPTSSSLLSGYPNLSVLQKRLDSSLNTQSQHSVSSRNSPRYIAVQHNPSEHAKDRESHSSARKARCNDQSVKTLVKEYPRFIVVESGPSDHSETVEKRCNRRGRRRKSLTTEKSHSV